MVPGVSSCRDHEVPWSISFSGSGFMATYQLGVAQCFRNHAPWILGTAPRVLGASAGSLVAAAVVCEINPTVIRDEMLLFAKQVKASALGPFNPSIKVFHWLKRVVDKHLPSDAHLMASGRLAVAMTRLADGRRLVMSDFQSRDDVAQALLCSCFVPGYCGLQPPSFNGVSYMDGGFTSFQPELPSRTLTVCPFSGESDICPYDRPSAWDLVVNGATLKGNMPNSFRIINALYPISLETLEEAFHSGYKDAIGFLLRNELVPSLTIHNLSDRPRSCNKTLRGQQADGRAENDDGVKVEEQNAAITSSGDYSWRQTGRCTEPQLAKSEPWEEPTLGLDVVKKVLLHHVCSYVSMFGLPARILSYLILPLMLLFGIVLQSSPRLDFLSIQALELVFWTWHSLRNFAFFVFSIFACSLKKYIDDRVFPLILFLQWLKSLTQHEDAPETLAAAPLAWQTV